MIIQAITESRYVVNAKRKIDRVHTKMAEVAHTSDNDNSPFRKAWMDFSGTASGVYNTLTVRLKRATVNQNEYNAIVEHIDKAVNDLVVNHGMKIGKITK